MQAGAIEYKILEWSMVYSVLKFFTGVYSFPCGPIRPYDGVCGIRICGSEFLLSVPCTEAGSEPKGSELPSWAQRPTVTSRRTNLKTVAWTAPAKTMAARSGDT